MYVRAEHQPISTEIKMLDGIFVKSMVVRDAGTLIPQHSHTYDHLSALVKGSVRLSVDGVEKGIFKAPAGILIEAGTKHLFETLEDNTAILCIHDLHAAEEVSIEEEHHIVGNH